MKFQQAIPIRLSGGGGGQRTGVVQRDGRCVRDDGGQFFPLGLTFMWSMQGLKHEVDHYLANIDWAAKKGFDFVRPLTEVDWAGNRRIDPTRPEWADWDDVLRQVIDIAYDLGVRSGITLRGKGTSVDYLWLARHVADIIAEDRMHKVLCCEMENESWNEGDPVAELVEMARAMAARIPNLLCLSAPPNTEEGATAMKQETQAAGLPMMVRHTERGDADFGWRQVRQGYDFKNDSPLVSADWEGPGPGSSGEVLTNTLQLAMKRALAIMCGAPIFILHTGTGVYGDGKPGSGGEPRPPNFWEIDNIDAIVSALRGVEALLPEGLPNWTVANTGWEPPLPVAPFQPKAYWEGDHGEGVNKAYAALAPDGRFIQMPIGVRGHTSMVAAYNLHDVIVYDPMTLQPVTPMSGSKSSYAKGETMQLLGGGQDAMVAYIIHGRR